MDLNNAIQIAVPFIARQEGFSPTPYLDAGSYAIGYGNHYYEDGSPVTADDDSITQQRAQQLLTFYVSQVASQIAPMLQIPVSDSMLAALTSLGYNWGTGHVGSSKVLNLINTNADSAQVIDQWNQTAITSQGVLNSDLVQRRAAESSLAYSSTDTIGTIALVLAGLFIFLFIYAATKKNH